LLIPNRKGGLGVVSEDGEHCYLWTDWPAGAGGYPIGASWAAGRLARTREDSSAR
jgi:hypothetical protein